MSSPIRPSHPSRRTAGKNNTTGSTSDFPPSETESASSGGTVGWRTALTAIEQNYGSRLADLEERLTTAERTVADLTGQIRNMR